LNFEVKAISLVGALSFVCCSQDIEVGRFLVVLVHFVKA